MSSPASVIVAGLLLAVLVTMFWREIAYVAVVLVIGIVFVGILTLVMQGQAVINRG